MPSLAMVKEQVEFLIRKGRGNEKAHLVLIEEEQKARIANKGPKPKTKFCFDTDDPMFYAEFNLEKDRILRHCGNKTVALTLMLRAWQELTPAVLDRWLAEGTEVEDVAL